MTSSSGDHADSEVQAIETQELAIQALQEFDQESNEVVCAELECDSDSKTPDVVKFSEYEFVADLLRRQDEVLKGLDQLNERIESVIDEISAVRQAEIDSHMSDEPESTQDDSAVDLQLQSVESQAA